MDWVGNASMKWRTDSAIEFTWPGVPVTACASIWPRKIEEAGGKIAGLPHDAAEGRAQQSLRLLLDNGEEAIST